MEIIPACANPLRHPCANTSGACARPFKISLHALARTGFAEILYARVNEAQSNLVFKWCKLIVLGLLEFARSLREACPKLAQSLFFHQLVWSIVKPAPSARDQILLGRLHGPWGIRLLPITHPLHSTCSAWIFAQVTGELTCSRQLSVQKSMTTDRKGSSW